MGDIVEGYIPLRMTKFLKHYTDSELCVLVRITENCSLACSYCYVRETTKCDFNIDTIRKLFEDIADFKEKKVRFIWHGGEPLFYGLEPFKKIINLQNKLLTNKKVKNSLQTNGCFENCEEIIDFLYNSSFEIGVSFDGCEALQNCQRPMKHSEPSYEKVSNFIKYLRVKTGKANIIQVVTPSSLNHIDEFDDSYKQLSISSVKFVPYHEFIENQIPSLTSNEYADFLRQLFDIWTKSDDPPYDISNFKEIFEAFLGGNMRSCSNNGRCLSHIMVNPNGDVFSCSRLSFLDEHKIGNINETTLKDILQSDNYLDIINEYYKEKSESCSKCKWFNMCFGGCYSHSLKGRNVYCSTYQKIFRQVKGFVDKYLKEKELMYV